MSYTSSDNISVQVIIKSEKLTSNHLSIDVAPPLACHTT